MCASDWINLISAVATATATILALCLAIQGNQRRIDCAFIWGTATNDTPTLILSNIGNRTVIVKKVQLRLHGQKIGTIDILQNSEYNKYAILGPSQTCKIMFLLDSLNLNIEGKPLENPDTLYKLTAIVETTTKKKFKSHYYYSYNNILGFYFTAGFDSM